MYKHLYFLAALSHCRCTEACHRSTSVKASGARVVVRVRQSVLGGAAHLLNFEGSDTMSAAYHVQYHLNKGVPVTQITPLLSRPHSLPQPTRYPDQGGPRGQGGPSSCHVDGTWGFSLRKGLVIQGRAGGGIADPDSCGVCVCVCVCVCRWRRRSRRRSIP